MQHEHCGCVERMKADNERLSKPQTCESLGYHICGSGNVEGKLRTALEYYADIEPGTERYAYMARAALAELRGEETT